ncbi:unnamed protein product [Notodromas monacha]|uniref:Dimethylglycine dehydrogenase n=1 Tax=Notodromas monacha TaxID=399045 RepID=A0A7R9BD10_9CRUS|nr:unnamed protein product [Notodromas monacha]CAG0913095.1 unnamed protein product [Notodromas monacha]
MMSHYLSNEEIHAIGNKDFNLIAEFLLDSILLGPTEERWEDYYEIVPMENLLESRRNGAMWLSKGCQHWQHVIASRSGLLNKNWKVGTPCLSSVLHHKTRSLSNQANVEEVDTLIVGGGIAGVSLAYHLAKRGQEKVVVLEKSDLTAGSTWHAAGLVTHYQPTVNAKRIHQASISLYSQLEKETGQSVGFHRCGSLRLATSPIRLEEMRYQLGMQNWQPVPMKLLSKSEVAAMVPFMKMDNVRGSTVKATLVTLNQQIHGGLFTAGDGHIDPYSLTMALAAGARRHGARLLIQTGAVSFSHNAQPHGSWEVKTCSAEEPLKVSFRAKNVVNAAGFWARQVGDAMGEFVPTIPVEHQYLITGPVPELEGHDEEFPVLRHLDGSFYMRKERGGLLIGPYESPGSMKTRDDWLENGVPPGFGKELFEPDLERLSPHLSIAMEAFPCFAKAEIKSVICGPITYSPDLAPLIGPGTLPNSWVMAGFGYGIVHAGGAGRYLADWIIDGEPPFDVSEYDPGRFRPTWTTPEYVSTKARESYGLNNALPYPFEERFAGRPTTRLSGVYEDLIARGAFMSVHAGWEQPAWFEKTEGQRPEYKPSFKRTNWFLPVLKECELVTNQVGIIDLTPFAKFRITGKDASKLLDFATSNKLPKVGRTVITHCLTPKGKVYAEITLTRLDENSFIAVTGSGSEIHDLRWLENIQRTQRFSDARIENVTDEFGVLGIAGPKSADVLAKLDSSLASMKFLSAKTVVLEGHDQATLILRLSYTGELGYEIYAPQDILKRLYHEILAAGQEFERGGLLIGPYESPGSMKTRDDWLENGVPPGFGKELFEPDLERLTMEAFPCFAKAEIKSIICGPITYSPDLAPLIGPGTLPNSWVMAGFGYGIVHAGGAGRYLADWIIDGEPPFDVSEYDPGRFRPTWTTPEYVSTKARESYGLNNALPYPFEERFAGRPTTRLSGVYEDLIARGAFMSVHAGWEQPAWFEKTEGQRPEYKPSFKRTNWFLPVLKECELVTNQVGIIDLTPFAKFRITGKDASKLLDFATSNKLPKVGRTVITHCLTPKGKVYAEITLTRLDENSFIAVTGSGSEIHDLRWLENIQRTQRFSDARIENVTDEFGVLGIAGPKSADVLAKLDSSLASMKFLSAKTNSVNICLKVVLEGHDQATLILRLSYTGELGYEIYAPQDILKRLYHDILAAGIGDFGTHALNILRMEKGFNMWGREMNMDTGPLEANLGHFICFNKDFIGKEAVVRDKQMDRSEKILVMLAVNSSDVDPVGNEAVWMNGKVVGNVTSGCFSPALNKSLAFAYIPPYAAVAGTHLQVELLGNPTHAEVLEAPPVKTYTARVKLSPKV